MIEWTVEVRVAGAVALESSLTCAISRATRGLTGSMRRHVRRQLTRQWRRSRRRSARLVSRRSIARYAGFSLWQRASTDGPIYDHLGPVEQIEIGPGVARPRWLAAAELDAAIERTNDRFDALPGA